MRVDWRREEDPSFLPCRRIEREWGWKEESRREGEEEMRRQTWSRMREERVDWKGGGEGREGKSWEMREGREEEEEKTSTKSETATNLSSTPNIGSNNYQHPMKIKGRVETCLRERRAKVEEK